MSDQIMGVAITPYYNTEGAFHRCSTKNHFYKKIW